MMTSKPTRLSFCSQLLCFILRCYVFFELIQQLGMRQSRYMVRWLGPVRSGGVRCGPMRSKTAVRRRRHRNLADKMNPIVLLLLTSCSHLADLLLLIFPPCCAVFIINCHTRKRTKTANKQHYLFRHQNKQGSV